MKWRQQEKDEAEAVNALLALSSQTEDIVHPPNTFCVVTQTDLMMVDVAALEEDCQRKTDELAKPWPAKGYSRQEDLQRSEKLVLFYMGVSSFTVLMALFRLVSVANPEGGATKLSKFEYFTLTVMKLWLNAINYDLGF